MNQIRQELLCGICHQLLTAATSLPCGHSFCCGCLKYFCANTAKPSCPQCQQPINQQNALKNLALQRVADQVRQIELAVAARSATSRYTFTDSVNDFQAQAGSPKIEPPEPVDHFVTGAELVDCVINIDSPSVASSTQSLSTQSLGELFDIFNKPVAKCSMCQNYIRIAQMPTHKQRCTVDGFSTFGQTQLRKDLKIKQLQQQKKTLKKVEKPAKNELKQVQKRKIFPQVTLATSIKQIRTSLTEAGFNVQLTRQLTKPKLIELHNKFASKLVQYQDFTGENLYTMVVDEILQDMGEQNVGKIPHQYYDDMLTKLLEQQDKSTLIKIRQMILKSKERREKEYIDEDDL